MVIFDVFGTLFSCNCSCCSSFTSTIAHLTLSIYFYCDVYNGVVSSINCFGYFLFYPNGKFFFFYDVQIDLSDDEEDLHPNIDKESWFRMKHRSRVEREDHEAKDRKRINEEVRVFSLCVLCMCSFLFQREMLLQRVSSLGYPTLVVPSGVVSREGLLWELPKRPSLLSKSCANESFSDFFLGGMELGQIYLLN